MKKDLAEWMKSNGASEDQVVQIFESLIGENGIGAQIFIDGAQRLVPLKTESPIPAQAVGRELAKFRSGEYNDWLLTLPEPSPDDLDRVLKAINAALPNLRQHLLGFAKPGPRHRRGGRRRGIPPEKRPEVCQSIRNLIAPGTKMQDVYKKVGRKYGVSDSSIKRIWLSSKPQNEQEKSGLE